MIELLSVVLHPGACWMDVYVKDPTGTKRKIEVKWFAKEKSDIPPAMWWESVVAEVEEQRANEAAKRAGRLLF